MGNHRLVAYAALGLALTLALATARADAVAPRDQPCEGRWALTVEVEKVKAFCRKGKRFSVTFDVLRSRGRYTSRMRPTMERKLKLEATPMGASCRLQWHEELMTTVASPYDLMVTDYELEVMDGVVVGEGSRSEATVGFATSCSERLAVTGTWRPLRKRDFRLDMRRVKKDLAELLRTMSEFCHDHVPDLQGPLSVELTIAKQGGVFDLVVNGQPFSVMEYCDRILSSNLLDLFPNPTGAEQRVNLEIDGTAALKSSR
jgi:hypothetical protein